ncbi:protein FAM172A [Echinococcus multilocularis]|uniref:Protein FAM172A n=1 Tax=Echinococcus multilocularis TaxID=6211 RepID=A0A068Y9D4_ECHMU|nr:protein FAM172A [Echinococcus multilocularis]
MIPRGDNEGEGTDTFSKDPHRQGPSVSTLSSNVEGLGRLVSGSARLDPVPGPSSVRTTTPVGQGSKSTPAPGLSSEQEGKQPHPSPWASIAQAVTRTEQGPASATSLVSALGQAEEKRTCSLRPPQSQESIQPTEVNLPDAVPIGAEFYSVGASKCTAMPREMDVEDVVHVVGDVKSAGYFYDLSEDILEQFSLIKLESEVKEQQTFRIIDKSELSIPGKLSCLGFIVERAFIPFHFALSCALTAIKRLLLVTSKYDTASDRPRSQAAGFASEKSFRLPQSCSNRRKTQTLFTRAVLSHLLSCPNNPKSDLDFILQKLQKIRKHPPSKYPDHLRPGGKPFPVLRKPQGCPFHPLPNFYFIVVEAVGPGQPSTLKSAVSGQPSTPRPAVSCQPSTSKAAELRQPSTPRPAVVRQRSTSKATGLQQSSTPKPAEPSQSPKRKSSKTPKFPSKPDKSSEGVKQTLKAAITSSETLQADPVELRNLSDLYCHDKYPNARPIFRSNGKFNVEMVPVPKYILAQLCELCEPLKLELVQHEELEFSERKTTAYERGIYQAMSARLIQRILTLHYRMTFTRVPLPPFPALSLEILHSEDFFFYTGPLLIVVQGCNESTLGVWEPTHLTQEGSEPLSRGLKTGSQIEFVKLAHSRGYRVAFLNLNCLVADTLVPKEYSVHADTCYLNCDIFPSYGASQPDSGPSDRFSALVYLQQSPAFICDASGVTLEERMACGWEALLSRCHSSNIVVWVHRRAEESFLYPLCPIPQGPSQLPWLTKPSLGPRISNLRRITLGVETPQPPWWCTSLSSLSKLKSELTSNPMLVSTMVFNYRILVRRLLPSESAEVSDDDGSSGLPHEPVAMTHSLGQQQSPGGASSSSQADTHRRKIIAAWCDRARTYWLSLQSRVKAVAFVDPCQMFTNFSQSGIGWGLFNAEMALSTHSSPQQDIAPVRKWFAQNAIQYVPSNLKVGEPLPTQRFRQRSLPTFSAGTKENDLIHAYVMTAVLDFFDRKLREAATASTSQPLC